MDNMIVELHNLENTLVRGIEIEKLIEFSVAVGYDREEAEEHIEFFVDLAKQYLKVRDIIEDDLLGEGDQ
ncbi:unnamed protein product [marine sediment metagenome]|uniref:Uncharacterized protein n=1 Tax=marine sediment metagenome TaxID=412755 RepID=X1EJD2_9ZZZZ